MAYTPPPQPNLHTPLDLLISFWILFQNDDQGYRGGGVRDNFGGGACGLFLY